MHVRHTNASKMLSAGYSKLARLCSKNKKKLALECAKIFFWPGIGVELCTTNLKRDVINARTKLRFDNTLVSVHEVGDGVRHRAGVHRVRGDRVDGDDHRDLHQVRRHPSRQSIRQRTELRHPGTSIQLTPLQL
jgi:hypothetical protein